jgi:hypothetical protein
MQHGGCRSIVFMVVDSKRSHQTQPASLLKALQPYELLLGMRRSVQADSGVLGRLSWYSYKTNDPMPYGG